MDYKDKMAKKTLDGRLVEIKSIIMVYKSAKNAIASIYGTCKNKIDYIIRHDYTTGKILHELEIKKN